MSARSQRRLTVEAQARSDIEDVLLFTEERWGAEQRNRYRAQLNHAIRSLLEFPERGQLRDDLYFGCRCLPVERHVIFYRLDGKEIVVGRVLHGSQEAAGKVRF